MSGKPRNGHTGGPNPPDYICPKRRERRPFTIYLRPEIKAELLETARPNGTTMQGAGEQLCQAYVVTGGRLLDLAKSKPPRTSPGGSRRRMEITSDRRSSIPVDTRSE